MNRLNIRILFSLSCLLLSCNTASRKNTISISGAWALYPMTVKWAEEYKKIHPGIRIDISAGGAGKGMTDVLGGMVDIGMVSREINPEELKRGAVPVPVVKDAVVAVTCEKNPHLSYLKQAGIDREKCKNIWITGDYRYWETTVRSGTDHPVHVFTRSDACGAAEIWAMYLGGMQEDLLGIAVYGDPGVAQAVKLDSLGIGYNNIGYAYDITTRLPVPGLAIVPIDLNGNGTIDENEDFYDSLDEMTDAIASGKYPSPPSRELYFVFKEKSQQDQVVTDFISWVRTTGQKYVRETGYVPLL